MSSSKNMRFYEGEEWETYIQLLLKRHYKLNYQEVPAKHKGDFGIEGYSSCGAVFQCYATEAYETNQRYEAQRKKITTDIGKFIKNKDEFIKLFGNTVINRWILLVPVFDSALLPQHASKKAKEVLELNLPYVSNDFKIFIATDDHFAKERNELANSGVIDIDIPDTEISSKNREEWLNLNDGLVKNLDIKGQKILGISSDDKIESFKRLIIDQYLSGQNLLNQLSDNYPDLYASLSNYKLIYESELSMTSLINDSASNNFFRQTLKEYEQNIKSVTPNLSSTTIKKLSLEAISDWLMRCPLDF
ncbi:hypothetical protein [Pseudanabaena mucicola]|uniref:Uncharacterized protein n=1 Tax=Pseudanabaena mucicola FACHB-723 TaxID=2692860 RepID=A0ABR7ZW86_9CYAN|nr:hypothetical protein [Pseudanabaena mucicola]MBD2187740.1 hypothetical protein [Pseudanabaena mucicola FACHB-723]